MKRIDGHNNLYKNEIGAVVNTDMRAFHKAKEKKKEKQRVDMLESKLERIESLLEKLIDVKSH